MIKSFNIHNLIKIKIEGKNKRQLTYFMKDYEYFLTDEENGFDFKIVLSKFKPENENCMVINHKYYVKENYIYCKDKYKIVRWEFCLKDLNEKPILYFNGGPFVELFLRDYLIEPIIAYLLAKKGFSLIHGSGVAVDNKGYIFPACKGVGKTSTMLNLIEDGGVYLSNEPIIISTDGKVYSFPTYIHFYHYNLISNPSFSKKLKILNKIELKLKHLVYILSLKYASFPLNLNPKTIFNEIGGIYPLESLILLNKTNFDTININENKNKEEIIKKLILINKFEMDYFTNLLNVYSYHPKNNILDFWEILKKNLTSTLSSIPCYEVRIPKKYDENVYNEIYKLVQKK